MRHYTVTMLKGFSMFKCPLCRYSVTTQEFDTQNGNLRTQATRAMNGTRHGCTSPLHTHVTA